MTVASLGNCPIYKSKLSSKLENYICTEFCVLTVLIWQKFANTGLLCEEHDVNSNNKDVAQPTDFS